MDIQVTRWRSERLQEELVHGRLPTGMDVFVWPKAGFSKQYAVFSTRYGSVDRHFFHEPSGQWLEVPDGIAHFLEHKLFEEEDGNVFDRFAALGASANAYTSLTMTSYLFSCSDHVYENLDILLDYVQAPHFTEENVEKEKGIIEQEIRMYDDHPAHRLRRNVLQALYHAHPVRIDILGTVESIRRIDPDVLYRCHETFYHPSNMALFVVGDVDPDKVLALVERDMAPRGYKPREPVGRKFPEEPAAVRERRVVDYMKVSRPRMALGFKIMTDGLAGRELLAREAALDLLLSAVFGPSSDFYERLYEEGLIDDGFGARCTLTPSFGFALIGGETPDPDKLHEAIRGEIERVRREGVDPEDVRRLQKRDVGAFIASLNSLEAIANGFLHYHFQGSSLFELLDIVEGLEVDDVQRALMAYLDLERSAVSIVLPAQAQASVRPQTAEGSAS